MQVDVGLTQMLDEVFDERLENASESSAPQTRSLTKNKLNDKRLFDTSCNEKDQPEKISTIP